ncbi:chromate efflux transporter [Aliiroseovarius subalbicans]|uniref:chromate efflux transporter n=1 Tax=Aliiroseovarius subalbicans TaxID=2925840 RepID=UPI001F5A894C|nr:chromate efflux transporter [Aliiroseovarius subalbicans]MCI2398538.1 chromate efflux transporter [Aliiroseovarius subalbicans]
MTTPNLAELTRVFARIGLMSFGGPAAQIAVMHRELVEDRTWLSEQQFLNALSFCMLLPGPEAMQLCTYAGWRLRGVTGGVIAGLLFVVPGALVMLALAWAYATWGSVPLVASLFLGIKATVIIIVLQALARLSGKTLKQPDRWVLAALSFLGIYALGAPFPLIIALAAAYGALTARAPRSDAPAPALAARTPRTIALWLALWWAPIAAAWALGADTLAAIGLFFSKLAVVTFGGAYAVLAYMTQEVVETNGWLSTAQMMDGLGLAETTPGPLILVTEFVGYLAGHNAGGPLLALGAAALTLWVTFVPCFLWIFTAAPYVEWIASRPRLTGALSAITAAVVGVIANLSLWFALHVFFDNVGRAQLGPFTLAWPDLTSFNAPALVLAALAAVLLLRLNRSLPVTLALMAGAGAGLGFIAG